MGYPLFIARRIIFNAQPSFSRFIIRLAVAATILSVATMVITLSLVNGFQRAVANKVYSFWGHARVGPVDPFQSMVSDEEGFVVSDSVKQAIERVPGVQRYHPFAIKSVVLKTGGQFEGVLLKGVGDRFDVDAFAPYMLQGDLISFTEDQYTHQVVLSHHTAARMQVGPGDTLQCFFIRSGQDIRSRSVVVSGIYKTGIEEYDKNFAIADIGLIRRLNLWDKDRVGGVEIFFDRPGDAASLAAGIRDHLPMKLDCLAVEDIYPNIFD
ncbi:MAG TPA: ABC transporter permease, partial [Phnomibacter sp.]|nr:ABC transporter permease [Phnomibacter sp.]